MNMEDFLAGRKATKESLLAAREEAVKSLESQMPFSKIYTEQERAMITQRMQNYPMDTQDITRQKCTAGATLFEQTHEACYNLCADNGNDMAFMSIGEGKCLRNCFTKTGYVFPAVQKSLRQSDETGVGY